MFNKKLLLTTTLAVLLLSSISLAAFTLVTPLANTISSGTILINATNSSQVFNATPVTFYYRVNNTAGTAGAWTSAGVAVMNTAGAAVVGFSVGFNTASLTDGNYSFNVSNATAGTLDTAVNAQVYLNNTAFTASITSSSGTVGSTSYSLITTTDENATCKWDNTAYAFGSMNNTFSTTGGTSHTTTVTGSFGTTTTLYVGCLSAWITTQLSDYANDSISFFPAVSGGVIVPAYRSNPAPSGTVSQSILIGSIGQGATGTVTVSKSEIAVKTIAIEVNVDVSNVQITVKKISGAPSTVTQSVTGTVYQYLDISASTTNDYLNGVTFTFAVPKAWFTVNNIATNTVKLNHWTGSVWVASVATQTNSDDASYWFTAKSTGFSPYAITGSSGAAPAAPANTGTGSTGGVPQPQPVTPITSGGVDNTVMYLVVAIVIIVGAAYFFMRRK